MDISEIPVLTKVVHKSAAPQPDMDELVAQLKAAILPEVMHMVASQLAAQSSDSLAASQQSLADYANGLQQELLSKAQSQMGDTIQSVEQAFTEAMGNVSKQQLQIFETTLESQSQQQLQAIEEKLAQLSDTQQQLLSSAEQSLRETLEKTTAQSLDDAITPLIERQQAQLEGRVQVLREQLERGLDAHLQLLQENSHQTLTAGQDAVALQLVEDYKTSLQQAFAELNATQLSEFRQNMQSELMTSEAALQEKVAAMVASQLQDIQAEMNKQLKARILEVLQGIKFVMPTL